MKKTKQKLALSVFRLDLMLSLFDMYYNAKKKGEDDDVVEYISRALSGLQKKLGIEDLDLYSSTEKGKTRKVLHFLNESLKSIEKDGNSISSEKLKEIIKGFNSKVDENVKNEAYNKSLKNDLVIISVMREMLEDF